VAGVTPDFTRLEDLADDAGVNPEDVREWLRREIERRREEQPAGAVLLAQPDIATPPLI
jgi:hypothetical protein